MTALTHIYVGSAVDGKSKQTPDLELLEVNLF